MNIIRHGDSEILEKMHMNIYFKCDACHCCFEADCSEYSVQMYRNPTTYLHYTVNCPDCNQKIIKELLYENVCDSENHIWDAQQDLKKAYRTLERRLEDQEKQLAERAMSIHRLEAERNQLKSLYDGYRVRYAEIEKAYKNIVNDSDTLLKQIIDAAYLGEMKGLEEAIIENPQRLIDKIRSLANTVKRYNKENTSD